MALLLKYKTFAPSVVKLLRNSPQLSWRTVQFLNIFYLKKLRNRFSDTLLFELVLSVEHQEISYNSRQHETLLSTAFSFPSLKRGLSALKRGQNFSAGSFSRKIGSVDNLQTSQVWT